MTSRAVIIVLAVLHNEQSWWMLCCGCEGEAVVGFDKLFCAVLCCAVSVSAVLCCALLCQRVLPHVVAPASDVTAYKLKRHEGQSDHQRYLQFTRDLHVHRQM
jgi:uncharacterized membrane protein YdcZ (DUF606 family)